MEFQKSANLVEDITGLGEKSRFLHEVMREHERCQLLQVRIFCKTAPTIQVFVVFLAIQTTDDTQLHKVVAKDGIAFKQFRFLFGDMFNLVDIYLI